MRQHSVDAGIRAGGGGTSARSAGTAEPTARNGGDCNGATALCSGDAGALGTTGGGLGRLLYAFPVRGTAAAGEGSGTSAGVITSAGGGGSSGPPACGGGEPCGGGGGGSVCCGSCGGISTCCRPPG